MHALTLPTGRLLYLEPSAAGRGVPMPALMASTGRLIYLEPSAAGRGVPMPALTPCVEPIARTSPALSPFGRRKCIY